MTSTSEDERARETRLRRLADRQGLGLAKSRTRELRAYEYGRFHIYDRATSSVVSGAHPRNYSLDLDEVEKYLTSA